MFFELLSNINLIEIVFHISTNTEYQGQTIICYLPRSCMGIQTLESYIDAFRTDKLFDKVNNKIELKFKLTTDFYNKNYEYHIGNNIKYIPYHPDPAVAWIKKTFNKSISFQVLADSICVDAWKYSFTDIFQDIFAKIVFSFECGWLDSINSYQEFEAVLTDL